MAEKRTTDRMINKVRAVPRKGLRKLRRARRTVAGATGGRSRQDDRTAPAAGRGATTSQRGGGSARATDADATGSASRAGRKPGGGRTAANDSRGGKAEDGIRRTATTTSGRWRDGYARGKRAARILRTGSHIEPLKQPEQLPRRLSEVLISKGLGDQVPAEQLDELRQLAISHRSGDRYGSSLAAMSLLAGDFQDPAAQAWLPVVFADAGRFEQAVEMEMAYHTGRPAASAYVLLVIALTRLGRTDEAEQRMRELEAQFPGLVDEFVHVWDDDPTATAFRRVHDASPAADGVLPVFYHLPFCAGTSQLISFRRSVPWAQMMHINRWNGLLQIEQARKLSADRARQLMLVHLHHPYPLRLRQRSLSYFTVLRDPVSQLSSGFHKRSFAKGIVATRDVGSQTFADHAEYTMRHGMTNMLARQIIATHPSLQKAFDREYRSAGSFTAISSEEDMFWLRTTKRFSDDQILQLARETLDERFHLVGTMKHLEASHLASAAGIGVPVAKRLPHAGKSGQKRAPKPEPDPVEVRLREANWVDQQLFDEYTARFEHDHGDLIEAVRQLRDVPVSDTDDLRSGGTDVPAAESDDHPDASGTAGS
jgi:hypothetical protein